MARSSASLSATTDWPMGFTDIDDYALFVTTDTRHPIGAISFTSMRWSDVTAPIHATPIASYDTMLSPWHEDGDMSHIKAVHFSIISGDCNRRKSIATNTDVRTETPAFRICQRVLITHITIAHLISPDHRLVITIIIFCFIPQIHQPPRYYTYIH